MKLEVEQRELSTIVASLGKSGHYFEYVRKDQRTADSLTVPGQNTALAKLHEIGQGAQFDTIPFSGSSLSLHNRAGQNFSVSYSVAGNLVDATGIPN